MFKNITKTHYKKFKTSNILFKKSKYKTFIILNLYIII